jgi:hypothetical protein
MVAHPVRDREVVGSSPTTPTNPQAAVTGTGIPLGLRLRGTVGSTPTCRTNLPHLNTEDRYLRGEAKGEYANKAERRGRGPRG